MLPVFIIENIKKREQGKNSKTPIQYEYAYIENFDELIQKDIDESSSDDDKDRGVAIIEMFE